MSNEMSTEAYAVWKAQQATARAAASRRSLIEHDEHLRQYGTLAKRAYMLEHGLEYRDQQDGRRVLTWAPSTVYSESAWDAKQRAAQERARTAAQRDDLYQDLQQAGVPGPRVSRGDVNAVGADMDSGPRGGALHSTSPRAIANEEGLRATTVNGAHGRDGTMSQEMYGDRPLVDALCARLAGYTGEGGRNEGAVEALDRLLAEVRAARAGGVTLGLVEQTKAPGKRFERSAIVAIIRGQKAIATSFQVREALDALARIITNLEE